MKFEINSLPVLTEAFELPPHQPKVFFLYAAGGCGKTYLLNLLLRHFRSNCHIAVATAMTGIAALLLDEGTTAHSRFGVPLQLDNDPISGLSMQCDCAKVL